ncbi:MAG TPA: hypothetical protein VMG39_10140 [Pseudolabrys sp.]|nr:hypothetical protein [Pseudolabrys sp.]
MSRLSNLALFLALSAAVVASTLPRTAVAAVRDGIWSVLVITEKGECDRGYRYEVKVAKGHITYNGDLGINLAGTVASDGATKVSIQAGEKGASGTGHLSERSGAGVWHGIGAAGSCAGRWEAELK